MPSSQPSVTLLVANHNGLQYLSDALRSAIRQTLRDIEIIVIDDASTDGSATLAHNYALADPRIKLVALSKNSGPSVARNVGLAAARGRWIAVLDNDDVMHPSRLERLVAEAEGSDAEICSDDLLVFQEGEKPSSLLSAQQRKSGWISAAQFIASNKLFSKEPALGYLKPLFRLSFLREHFISYNPALRIGEDYDLVVQALARGARFRMVEMLGYFYRKHPGSLSHRISTEELQRLIEADSGLQRLFEPSDTCVKEAFEVRRRSIKRAIAFSNLVSAIKERRWLQTAVLAIRHPETLPLLALPVKAKLRRAMTRTQKLVPASANKRACVISRQRLIGNTNGSSAYLLSLCNALHERGYRISLISPSPATFGRWPFLFLRPEMRVFADVSVRGSWRFGRRLFIAKDPRIIVSTARTLAGRVAARLGLKSQGWEKRAPYAIAAPWSVEDQLFIAQRAPRSSDLILADYAFTTPAIPYAMSPSARSAVVMHDFFSDRANRFRRHNLPDSVAALDEATEAKLLGQAEAIVAIQQSEAQKVKTLLPAHKVLLAPMAIRARTDPQPGDNRTVLFVGSNHASNVIGLKWFLEAVWPAVRKSVSDCDLLVAGSVISSFPDGAAGVRFLGLIPDLEPLYAKAGVIVSPVTIGSGLKIKLIEALGHGKAVVATSVTIEGVEEAVAAAVAVRDEPSEFARAIVELLSNPNLRLERSHRALETATQRFSPDACYREFLAFADPGEFPNLQRDRSTFVKRSKKEEPTAPC
jgi:glycosyltransferase involved in cell wall biosynthesis